MSRNSRFQRLGFITLALAAVALIGAGCPGDEGDTIINNYTVQDDPFLTNWTASAHADATSEAFRHWDDDGTISTSCAKCHSTGGFQDFLGDDGSAVGTVDAAAPLGTTVECDACHNGSAWSLASVTFPSGVTKSGLGHEAICMQCHQGRQSTDSVESHITSAAVATDDTVDTDLSFRNVHYFAAGATRFGGEVRGGLQYSGMEYYGYFPHAQGYEACQDCHEKHTLELKVNACAQCHDGITTVADIPNIRQAGSFTDFDGDGNITEGIKAEIDGLMAVLYAAIQEYGSDVAGTDIGYAANHPYFFVDTNGNGTIDATETTSYDAWTARLIRAAYNYQYALKDPGGYAHNGKYIVEILYDSIADLNSHANVDVVTTNGYTVNFTALNRNDHGHFDHTAEAFRHWDGDDAVDTSCSICHTPTGFLHYISTGGQEPWTLQPLPERLTCETCHTGTDYLAGSAPRHVVAKVVFPSGEEIDSDGLDDSFICMTCHSGRVAKSTIDAYTSGTADDTIKTGGRFQNVHYLPAGAVLNGDDAMVGYQYTFASGYTAQDEHNASADMTKCNYCHGSKHNFSVADNLSNCTTCHTELPGTGALPTDLTRVTAVRTGTGFDNDVDGATNTLKEEVDVFAARLMASIREYAFDTEQWTGGTASVVYDASSYPYWFLDEDNDGVHDTTETTSYSYWTPRLLRAAHNYQIYVKDPGCWAHNHEYILQLLYDSMYDLDNNSAPGTITVTDRYTALTRP